MGIPAGYTSGQVVQAVPTGINSAFVYLGGTTGSASASINVDSVFSATYTNYLVQISSFTASVEDFWAILNNVVLYICKVCHNYFFHLT